MLAFLFWCLFLLGFILLAIAAKRSLYHTSKESVVVKKPKVKLPKIKNFNPLVEEEILSSLQKFERDKKYLEKDMKLSRLADLLGTNTKYTAMVITKYRGKGFVEYLTDLRIEYAVHLLTTENNFRHYSHAAMGEEVGFGSTRSFLKAFRQKTTVSPAEFVARLGA